MNLKDLTLAVLAGGPSCEREVSLVSGKAVHDALTGLGLNALLVDPDPAGHFVKALKDARVQVAFIALHGTFGEDGIVQTMLEEAGIAYTGPGPAASRAAFDKARSQEIFKKAGITVPEFMLFNAPPDAATLARLTYPAVVKPSAAGSSVGIAIVQDAAQAAGAAWEAFKYSNTVLIERYIRGRELTAGVLGGEALPVVEIIPARAFYDYEAKYRDSGTRYEAPAALDPAVALLVQRAALKAYTALGCEVMARIDFILSADGTPYALEANTIPGLTGKSLLPKAAKAKGLDFQALCVKILELSLSPDLARNRELHESFKR